MQTTQEQKTTSKETAAALAQREEEERRGRGAVDALVDERTTLATDYAADMSLAKRTKVETADEKIKQALLTHEALVARTSAARRVHEATVRAEKKTKLRELVRRADPARARETMAILVTMARDFDRAFAAALEEQRVTARAQRDAVTEARALAEELGEDVLIEEVFVDDMRVVAGVAIARDRSAANRATCPTEEFLAPIASAFVRDDLGRLVVNPACDEQAFARASSFVDALDKKGRGE